MTQPSHSQRAVSYTRMSTDGQNCSIQHQLSFIEHYAQMNGISIVRSYSDAGRSGLNLQGRPGLRQLLADVLGGSRDFSLILVYDVSRWGRFQDVDEAAHYEFLCRQAGAATVYVAESFQADASPYTAIVKNLKRTMAAEYSRDLSEKVHRALCRFVAGGFKAGGVAGYGLRRMCVAHTGEERRLLEPGERKVALTDRVRLVPGPPDEMATVREIYRLYLDEKRGDSDIARILIGRGVANPFVTGWNSYNVRQILTSEKYAGVLLYNRSSAKLATRRVATEPDQWVRLEGGLGAIVSAETFAAAQAERARRQTMPMREAILARLAAIYQERGAISSCIITTDPGMPNPNYLRNLFGSLSHAYQLAGVPAQRTSHGALSKAAVMQLRRKLVLQAEAAAVQAGAQVARGRGCTIIINHTVTVKLAVACCRQETATLKRWRLSLQLNSACDFVLYAKLDQDNASIACYYLLPLAHFTQKSIWLRPELESKYRQFRHAALASVFGLPPTA